MLLILLGIFLLYKVVNCSQLPEGLHCEVKSYRHESNGFAFAGRTTSTGSNQKLLDQIERLDVYGDCDVSIFYDYGCTNKVGDITNIGPNATTVYGGYGDGSFCTTCSSSKRCPPYQKSTWHVVGNGFCSCYDFPSRCSLPNSGYFFRCIILKQLSGAPTLSPSSGPTAIPSTSPSFVPSMGPSSIPSISPTFPPSHIPSQAPSTIPSTSPSSTPSMHPSMAPTISPSHIPSLSPTLNPSTRPTSPPSTDPTLSPTHAPSTIPTWFPTVIPSTIPTSFPSHTPSALPSKTPTNFPTTVPSEAPSHWPSSSPSYIPSSIPTLFPSTIPTTSPTRAPTKNCPGCITVTIAGVDQNYERESVPVANKTAYKGRKNPKHRIFWNDTTLSWVIEGSTRLVFNPTYESLFPPRDEKWTSSQQELSVQIDCTCKETSHSTATSITNRIGQSVSDVSIVIIAFGALTLTAAAICMKIYPGSDRVELISILKFHLQVLDFGTDGAFCFLMYSQREKFQALFISSVVFVSVPYVANLGLLLGLIMTWKQSGNISLNQWLNKHSMILVILWGISGNAVAAITLTKSKIFYISRFSLPIRRNQVFQLGLYKVISSIVLENIPQCVIQVVYITQTADLEFLPLLSLSISLLSIIVFCANEITKCQSKAMYHEDGLHFLITFTSENVRTHHKYATRLLGSVVGKVLGVSSNFIEIYDVRKPEACFGRGLSVCGVIAGETDHLTHFEKGLSSVNDVESEMNEALRHELAKYLKLGIDGDAVPFVNVDGMDFAKTAA